MKQYIQIGSIFFILGFLFFMIQDRWIVFMYPLRSKNFTHHNAQNTEHKQCTLYMYTDNAIKTESTNLVWSKDYGQNIKLLINNLISLMIDEKIIVHDIQIVSAAVNDNQTEVFLNFSQYPFEKMSNIHKKLLILESIMKTIKLNCPSIQTIRFLTAHQPINDDHLNFSISWPISGFFAQ